jgi:hypothetical protein
MDGQPSDVPCCHQIRDLQLSKLEEAMGGSNDDDEGASFDLDTDRDFRPGVSELEVGRTIARIRQKPLQGEAENELQTGSEGGGESQLGEGWSGGADGDTGGRGARGSSAATVERCRVISGRVNIAWLP